MVSTAVRTFARGIPGALFLLTLGCGLFALGVKAIAIPLYAPFPAAYSGTRFLINYMTETLSPAVWNVLLNIPIFIAGWLFVGRRFVPQPVWLAVVSVATQYLDMTINITDPILASITAGCICGSGSPSIVLHSIGCDGGLTTISFPSHCKRYSEVIQPAVQHHAVCTGLFPMYNPEHVVFADLDFRVLKVMDYVSTIFNQRKMVIISTQHAAIREDILTHLHRGATLPMSGSGGFTGEQRPVLVTVVQTIRSGCWKSSFSGMTSRRSSSSRTR